MHDIVYNEIVATPGYELEFAVGTTYSLDVDVFIAMAMAFGRLGEITDADLKAPLRLLEGVRKANNKIALFCNRGGITPPTRKNALSAMLDKSIFEVADDRIGRELASFHPKLWIIKEQNIDDRTKRQIKLIVLSRNLTKDTSLDVAASLTAPLTGGTPELRRKHAPLKELLLRLVNKADTKKKQIRKLANDIDKLGTFELNYPYVDYDFLPIHFGENLNPKIDFREAIPGEKMMVVSPFIDSDTLKWLNGFRPSREKVLVTRLDSLTPEIMALCDGENSEVWVMSQVAEQNDVQAMNLHAKMYFSYHPRSGGVHLWLGSANATKNGFFRNSEFLLGLTYRRGNNQFSDFKNEFCAESKQLCQKIESLPENEPIQKGKNLTAEVRKWLINHGNLSAQVTTVQEGYDVTVSAKRFKPIAADVTIAPMQTPDNFITLTTDAKSGTVHIINKNDLSDFYILSVMPHDESMESFRKVIKIPTGGIPDDRDDSIFSSIIDTRDKFLSYVEMMISDRPQELTAMLARQFEKGGMSHTEFSARTSALYESLLRIAAVTPDKLNEIQEIVPKLAEGVVPDSFIQMSATFQRTVKKLK